MRVILLDPEAQIGDQIGGIMSKVGVDGLRSKLAFFDGLFVLKEHVLPSIGMGFGGESPDTIHFSQASGGDRRLNLFNDEPVQNYLATNRMIFTQKFDGDVILSDAVEEVIEGMATGHSGISPMQIVLTDRLASQFDKQRPSIVLSAVDGFSSPPEDTPIEEVLLFKERRKSELDAFWQAMEAIADDVAFIRDHNLLSNAKGRLVTALRDYEMVAKERWTGIGRNVLVITIATGLVAAEFSRPGFEWRDFLTEVGAIALSVSLKAGPGFSSPDAHAMSYASRLKTLA